MWPRGGTIRLQRRANALASCTEIHLVCNCAWLACASCQRWLKKVKKYDPWQREGEWKRQAACAKIPKANQQTPHCVIQCTKRSRCLVQSLLCLNRSNDTLSYLRSYVYTNLIKKLVKQLQWEMELLPASLKAIQPMSAFRPQDPSPGCNVHMVHKSRFWFMLLFFLKVILKYLTRHLKPYSFWGL